MAGELHSDFEPRLKSLQQLLREQYGVDTTIGSGGRSMQEQARLYAQGRTTPGPIVTHAPPGSSYHNFGAAVDLRPAGGATEAQLERALRDVFSTQASRGLAPGLTWGGTFKNLYDPLHVQLGVSLDQLRSGYKPPEGLAGLPAGRGSAPVVAASGTGPMSVADILSSGQRGTGGSPQTGLGQALEGGFALPPPPAAPPQTPPLPEFVPMQVQASELLRRFGGGRQVG